MKPGPSAIWSSVRPSQARACSCYDQFPRSHAIYLARAADAYLAMRDLDAAVDQAAHAYDACTKSTPRDQHRRWRGCGPSSPVM